MKPGAHSIQGRIACKQNPWKLILCAPRNGVSVWGEMILLRSVRTDQRRMMKINALGQQREKAMQTEGTSFVFQIFTYFTLVHVYPYSLT